MCEQIGQFLKSLGNKYDYIIAKLAQIFTDFWRNLERAPFEVKTTVVTFLGNFGRNFLFQQMVTLPESRVYRSD